jgi:hypothetical protein
MSTVGEELPKEMARVRDHVLPHFVEIGPAGAIGAMLIRADLDRAAKAMAEGDVVEMIRVLQSLKETNA